MDWPQETTCVVINSDNNNWILNVDQIVPQAYCQVTLNLNATILHNIEKDNGVVGTAFKHIQPLENWTTILRNECCL